MPTIAVTDETFGELVLRSPLPVLVDFWGPACGPCVMMAPVLEELADEFESVLTIAKLDVSTNPATAAAYGVISIPTLNVYIAGELSASFVGGRPKRFLKNELDALVSSPPVA